mmetsp:Transcript_18034/g.44161  ORF Transcript_18034/g.44161 Transcript_18034/m.44161 type:complete len:304 (-) Transcript_18034:4372-5283(-)
METRNTHQQPPATTINHHHLLHLQPCVHTHIYGTSELESAAVAADQLRGDRPQPGLGVLPRDLPLRVVHQDAQRLPEEVPRPRPPRQVVQGHPQHEPPKLRLRGEPVPVRIYAERFEVAELLVEREARQLRLVDSAVAVDVAALVQLVDQEALLLRGPCVVHRVGHEEEEEDEDGQELAEARREPVAVVARVLDDGHLTREAFPPSVRVQDPPDGPQVVLVQEGEEQGEERLVVHASAPGANADTDADADAGADADAARSVFPPPCVPPPPTHHPIPAPHCWFGRAVWCVHLREHPPHTNARE